MRTFFGLSTAVLLLALAACSTGDRYYPLVTEDVAADLEGEYFGYARLYSYSGECLMIDWLELTIRFDANGFEYRGVGFYNFTCEGNGLWAAKRDSLTLTFTRRADGFFDLPSDFGTIRLGVERKGNKFALVWKREHEESEWLEVMVAYLSPDSTLRWQHVDWDTVRA